MASIINANNSGVVITTDLTSAVNLQTANTTAMSIDSSQNANITSTGAIIVPVGTTAQRPTGSNGMVRYNTSNNAFEVYTNSSWKTKTVTSLPVNSVTPVISGSAIVGQTLTSTTGTWSQSPTSYGYQWRANAVNITSATANTFVLTSTQAGANLTCNVTATNAAGTANAITSNSLGPVVNEYSASYLVVAGGGAGGTPLGGYNAGGAGGGAGGMLTGTLTFTPGTVYTAVVGGGGTNGGAGNNGNNGTNSSLTGVTAAVGGGGGANNGAGNSGGSGGGAGSFSASNAAGTAGQGNQGGAGGLAASPYPNAGGGGKGAAGGNYSGSTAGAGGSGAASSITGSSITYAGGGGGSAYTPLGGVSAGGGSGGGGYGGATGYGGGNGGTNLGGGGGGGASGDGNIYYGGSGGSGVVILSVPTSRYSGTTTGSPTITTSGSNTIIKFNSSGTYTA